MKKVLIVVVVFFLGFLSSFALSYAGSLGKHVPFIVAGAEVDSPGNWVELQQVHAYKDKVVIDLSNVMVSSFADTNSMDPLLDAGANGLEIRPIEGRLKVGDVVSYKSKINGATIIHRIAEIKEDEEGTYYVMKPDNGMFEDMEKVRFDQFEGVLVGILY